MSDARPRLPEFRPPHPVNYPPWYEDLHGGERVDAEAGTLVFSAAVEILYSAEQDHLVGQAAEAGPVLAAAREAARTPIPVITVTPADGSPPTS